MNPQRWQRIEEIYHSALRQAPETRVAFVTDACCGDGDLLQEVQSLLSADEQAGSFLETPALGIASTLSGVPQLSRRLGSYQILSPLGAGGMGEVYRAHDSKLGRDVAIKTLPGDFADDPERLARLRREALTLASLNHPNIGAIYDLEEADGVNCLVLELVEGETLRGPLPVEKALDYARQVAEALESAHNKGIVHRDLKPANVKVTPEGRVKVLDFGLAKAAWAKDDHQRLSQLATGTASGTVAGQIMGTPPYMSPEQARGEATDKRTDIWAFACLLYELLTGQRAFKGANLPDTVSAVLEREPYWCALPAKTPAKIRHLLRQCLQKDASRRPQDMSSVRSVVEEVIGSFQGVNRWQLTAATAIVLAVVVGAGVWLFRPRPQPSRADYIQLTNFADSVTQPALSPDGRLLTFIRGPKTFAGPGQIYVKVVPQGEAEQLTRDDTQKMSPVFSPDGSQIAYTTIEQGHWDTWLIPISGGQPHLWMPNASGLTWLDKQNILFSEIKSDIHMAIVKAKESRAGEQDVYVPRSDRGMAHRSYPSPDSKWSLVVEMDRAVWLPCRLVPLDGTSPGHPVGPAGAECTSAAWSPDGKWMYLNSSAGGAFHIWRQRFPDGRLEQVTSGPAEEEGMAIAPGGRSLITAVGLKQSSVWVHDSAGERQVSLEGYSYDLKFTPDGRRLCYRVLKGTLASNDASELRVVELESGRNEPLLPGFAVAGYGRHAYDISPDGRRVVVAVLDRDGRSQLWLAPLGRGPSPHQIGNVQGGEPLFGPNNEILFRGFEGTSSYIYRIREDGTKLEKLIEQPVVVLVSISPSGQWVVAKIPGKEGSSTQAFPVGGGSPVRITVSGGIGYLDHDIQWPTKGNQVFIGVNTAANSPEVGRTYAIPLSGERALPQIPVGGFKSEAEIARLPGAQLIDAYGVTPGAKPGVYAFMREGVQRNLYRIPLQ
jgi:eukaryotic-like serine/threonine-protein kinase